MMRYHDRTPRKVLGKPGPKPTDVLEVDRPGVSWTKCSAVAVADQVKGTHAGLSRLHCSLNRSLIGAIQSEIRPQCCPEKPHTANDNTAAIENVDSQTP